jgi:pimeloyl-ACP methyl ester carboxylesterase
VSLFDQLGEAREARLPQGTIRYREAGSGRPVVFVHGVLVNGLHWRKVAPLLTDRFRCIVPDWPLGAHSVAMSGDADLSPAGIAALIDSFLGSLGLDDATLVGNDSGVAFSQIAAVEHPARIGAMVLASGDAYDHFFPPMFRVLPLAARLPGSGYLIARSLKMKPLRRLPNTFGWLSKQPIPDEIVQAYVGPPLSDAGVRRDLRKALRDVSSRYTLDAAAKLGTFEGPVLLPWAKEDRFFPFAHAERLAATLPNARVVPIEDSWSFIPEDQPERLAEAIRSFLG